ncbi:MAG TPA: carboxypeptidase regulatory-like domain-containing protein [Candidatus Angelobacter sp.]|nr:carboxypeptidase regulatory-like domain-containing protein [Candidatus Angelobacter sp.]
MRPLFSSRLWNFALVLVLGFTARPFYGQASSQGQWSPLQTWPNRAVHAALLPDGRVFFLSFYNESLQPNIWDPVSNTFAPTVSSSYALFCGGHTTMADGRIFIAGGHIADYTGYTHASIFDPFKNTLTQVPDMNQGRWYPTTTVLGNGDILVVSGDINSNTNTDTLPQVFQVASGTWRNLTSAQLLQSLYPLMFVAPNGKVIYAGPEPLSRYLDTTGTGTWTNLATRKFTGWRDYGPGVMYESGKILLVGGSDPPVATAETIDLNAPTPTWNFTGSMHFARRQDNAVILPDGKVLIVGGSSGSGFDNNNAPVFPTEMWDPATGQFTVMASIAVYRGYHSTAMLLPDGRVLSAGGNVGGANAQYYSPPYLFNGARPSISSAPASVGYGQTVFIGTPDATSIANVTWLRTSAVTHTFDESGRFMHLSFTQANGGLNVTMPANGNIAPPGYYMLFILNSAGVPSVAKIIQITQGGATTGTLTGTVKDTSGSPLANASVTSGSSSANSAADGTYTLANVNAGTATVTASLSGYNSASTQVTVTAGASTNVPDLNLAPINPGDITGNVVDGNGNAIASAAVTGGGLATVTDSLGSYTLHNEPAGSINLTASASGFQPASETVTVTAGTTTTAPPLTLTSNLGNVSGKVSDTSANPISGATVSFGGGTTSTDSTGTYNFTNIPAGAIQLVASATGFQSVTQNVTVTGGKTTTANFTLTPGNSSPGTVTGTVTNFQTHGIIAGATVKWNTASATDNASGVYTLNNVGGGTQSLTASATGYLPVTNSVNVGGSSTTLNFALSTAGILNVKVVNSSGAAVSGAPVSLSGGQIQTSLSGTTNASGVYSSGWIPIGNYAVTSGSASQQATVATGQTTTITITQTGGNGTGTISGTVTDSSGAALSGATVSAGGVTTTTQANGGYTLNSVPAGTVTVTASMSGFQTASQTVSLAAGGTATANFALSPAASTGTVTGTITNITNGMVLSEATVKWNSMAVSTNSSGVYTMSSVSSGNQTLTASATGYLARNGTVTVNGGATSTLNIQLSTAGIISVKAVSPSGAADVGATVNIQGGGIFTNLTGTTNASGVWSSSWIPIGTYTVTISQTGHTTQSKSASVSPGVTTTVNFTF